jgi:hypothetical protein
MGNWFTQMNIESSENASKNINYYFGQDTTTVIPTKFYHPTVTNHYAGYPFGIVLKPDDYDFEEISL